MNGIRTRFAPSPTGSLHIGGIRTLLYNWAFARKNKGKVILRIEDTDKERLVPGATEEILEMIKAYGLDYDEGPYIQSERLEIYKRYATDLVKKEIAYCCFCSEERLERLRQDLRKKSQVPKYDRHCLNLDSKEINKKINSGEKYVIRLKIPDNKVLKYKDLVMGDVSFNTKDLDDQVLLKSDGYPTYHLAVCVDDGLMKISHILRGTEWLPSTPKHLLIFEALGFPIPQIGHMPIILDPGGGKLSKRKGSVAAKEFLAEGYLPEAILNFLMLSGWAFEDEQEIFSLKDFVQKFLIERINKANPVFNREKLDWFNGVYIRKTQNSKLKTQIYQFYKKKYPEDFIEKIIPLVKDRMVKLTDFETLAAPILKPCPSIDKSWLPLINRQYLEVAIKVLSEISDWKLGEINNKLTTLINKSGWKTGDFYMSLRIAICGSKITPPINETMEILGKKQTLSRLKKVLAFI